LNYCISRFTEISRCLHFIDNASVPANNKNRFLKLGTFLPNILKKFEDFIVPGEFLCIDESLMPYKGRLSFKQYVPSKRARFGVLFYALVDCESKALLKLIPYQGKSTLNDFKEFGVKGTIVLHLLENMFNKNHRLVSDNWFNSPPLAKLLKSKGVHVLGTLQKRRSGKLKELMKQKLRKGSVESFTAEGLLVER